jgi:hypothetical protein
VRDDPATLGPNRRPALIVGGHSSASDGVGVPQSRMGRHVVLHGVGNWRPTRRCERARSSIWCHVRVDLGLLVLTFSCRANE